MSNQKLAANEYIKIRSNYLRGNLAEDIANISTGEINEDNQQLIKFHGSYMQDDRDLRPDRRKHKLEKAFSFMIRIRVPGGVATPHQWLETDRICEQYGNYDFKLTTRQAFQLHGVIKSNLKRTIQEINKCAMDTIAACGDVNRNVMCNPNPFLSHIHADVLKLSQDISTHLTPATRAYHEIWLDGEKIESSEAEEEPIYGKTYLPRKFKITIAVPPSNDVDIFANCLSFIAVVENDKLIGYNVAVGGGMGMTHGDENTFPRTADVIGFCTPEQAVEVSENVVKVQRDFGCRTDRKRARMKYTVEDRGADWILAKLNEYLGWNLQPVKPYIFENNGDRYGWVTDPTGNSHLTVFVEGGRIIDRNGYNLRTGLKEIAKIHTGDFRLTANQNVIIANVSPAQRPIIEKLVEEYQIEDGHKRSAMRLNALACVALPTCGLSLAEAERYLPTLITDLEETLETNGLTHDAITIRMTGCPNGCARPYIAEIGFVGRGPNRYNVYLGGGHAGQRLNKLYKADVSGNEIKSLLSPIISQYAKEREQEEKFGDFVIRAGVVKETKQGNDFHKNIGG
jgi:sulfite reductase (NADPH) hemoprotein beta-component